MLQLHNNTPFAADMNLFANEQAIDTLYLLVKATFNIGEQWTLAEEQEPPVLADIYWGDPDESSIRYGSDCHIGKPCSDIIVLGNACAPGGRQVTHLDVNLSVGQMEKTVRVFGDRQWQNGRISSPRPFETMAMVYEKAFGGTHIVDGETAAFEERNPLGTGFAGLRKAAEMDGVALPNLEDPVELITDAAQRPRPACFAVCAPHWQPRAGFAGTYDDVWQHQRAPYLPEDFDRRFCNMAHPDLIYPGFLSGGEHVEISNMHPRGTLKFVLPHVKLNADVVMAGASMQPRFDMETLVIEPNELKLTMTWRASLECDKKVLKISRVDINMAR